MSSQGLDDNNNNNNNNKQVVAFADYVCAKKRRKQASERLDVLYKYSLVRAAKKIVNLVRKRDVALDDHDAIVDIIECCTENRDDDWDPDFMGSVFKTVQAYLETEPHVVEEAEENLIDRVREKRRKKEHGDPTLEQETQLAKEENKSAEEFKKACEQKFIKATLARALWKIHLDMEWSPLENFLMVELYQANDKMCKYLMTCHVESVETIKNYTMCRECKKTRKNMKTKYIRCRECLSVYFCSVECERKSQRKQWSGHWIECELLKK